MNRRTLMVALVAMLWLPGVMAAAPTANVEAQLAAARQDLDARRPAAAGQRWLQIARQSNDEAVLEEVTRACYDHQQLRAALQSAQKWLSLNPTSQQAREIAAFAALKLFLPDEAATHMQALVASAYISPAAGLMELSGKVDSADSAAALLVFTRLASQFPEVAEAHHALARFASAMDDLTLMQRSAARAWELAPTWSPAGLQLARAQLAAGFTESALATAQAVVKQDDSIATRSEYANVLLLANRVSEAVTLWRELEASTEGDPSPAIRALAQIDVEVGNYQSAFNRFNRLLNTGRGISESMFYLGMIAERTGANDEARQLYDRVQEGEFASAAQLRVAKLIQASDGLPAALDFLQSYADNNPDQVVTVYKARAELLNEARDEKAALALLDEAVASYPDVASLQLAQAYQQIRMHKVSAGARNMRALLKSRPQDPTLLNALGYTLIDNNQELNAGRNYIAEALKLSPDSAAILDSMGWALFKLGQREQALEYLQRAATRMVDPELDLHLGEVLWSLGQRDEALTTWKNSLTRHPDNQALQDRLKRAQAGR